MRKKKVQEITDGELIARFTGLSSRILGTFGIIVDGVEKDGVVNAFSEWVDSHIDKLKEMNKEEKVSPF